MSSRFLIGATVDGGLANNIIYENLDCCENLDRGNFNYKNVDNEHLNNEHFNNKNLENENLNYENLGYENFGYENFGCENLGYENLGYENFGYETLTTKTSEMFRGDDCAKKSLVVLLQFKILLHLKQLVFCRNSFIWAQSRRPRSQNILTWSNKNKSKTKHNAV